MKLTRPVFALFTVFALFAVQSCSNSTTPPPTTPPTTVVYDSGAVATYQQFKLDTANGTYGRDQPIPSSNDTVTSRIVSTTATYQGKSNVIEMISSHSASTAQDTIYVAQDSSKLYRYNYGVETLNNNAAVSNFLGSSLQLGWVEQVELAGSENDTWTTNTSIGPIAALGGASFPVKIVSTQFSDTTMVVASQSVTAKHAHHLIYIYGASSTPIAQGSADTYVDLKLGTVLNIVHNGSATVPAAIQSPGLKTTLIKHS